jgi:hypothetical protein
MDADDGLPGAGGEFIDLATRLAHREAELRDARADQSEVRRRLIRAEDRAVKLRWQLDLVRVGRSYRALELLQAARRSPGALLRLPAGLLRLTTSPGPRAAKPLDPDFRGREEHTLAGWAAYDRGDYEAAIAQAQAVLSPYPDDYPALDLKQSAHWRRGDVAVTLGTLRRMRAVQDSARLAATVRSYVGRARALDHRWQPRVPGPPHPVEPRDGVIMHLAQESIPYQVNSFTTRSSHIAAAQRQAGLDPFVVTSLGFPRTAGVSGFPPVEVIEGTPYHRIDPGADYPAGQPSDVLVTDTAWLAARIGRQQRPAVIHAGAGRSGFETALVGLALREHLCRPLVYEAPSFPEATSAGDADRADQAGRADRADRADQAGRAGRADRADQAGRADRADQAGQAGRADQGEPCAVRRASEIRCMREADLVVTASDAARSEIIAAGVPAHQVVVVPDGAPNGERYRDIYRELVDRWRAVPVQGATPETPGQAVPARGTTPRNPRPGGAPT